MYNRINNIIENYIFRKNVFFVSFIIRFFQEHLVHFQPTKRN